MIVTTDILGLKGIVQPQENDALITVPPFGFIPFPLRKPIQSLSTAPAVAASFSFLSVGNVFVPASTAAQQVLLGVLDVGLWELHGAYRSIQDWTQTAQLDADLGITIAPVGTGINGFKWLIGTASINLDTRYAEHKQITLQLDKQMEVAALAPATGVGQTARVYSTLVAIKLA